MAITRLGGANAISGTLPAANINDTSIGNITALPAAIKTGGLVHLSTTNISDGDSEVELTFTSDHDNYRIVISDLVPQNTSGTDGRIYLKRSGQSSYDSSANNYWRTGYDMKTSSTTMNGTGLENGSNAQIIGWNIDGDNANASSYSVVEIGGVNNTSAYTMIDCFSMQYPRGDSQDDMASIDYHYFHSQAGKVTNLKLSPGSGNWQSGKVMFYGYKE